MADWLRIVTVAGKAFELNATNAEVIIGTVIEEANKGEIDLNGFSSFWSFVKQEVNATLGAYENELKPIASACSSNVKGYTCTGCVCDYRNKVIAKALADVEQVNHFNSQLFTECVQIQMFRLWLLPMVKQKQCLVSNFRFRNSCMTLSNHGRRNNCALAAGQP